MVVSPKAFPMFGGGWRGFNSQKSLVLFFISLFLLIVLSLPLIAQDDPDEYPTLVALSKAVIPPRDRVELAQQIFGVESIAPPPQTPTVYQVGDRKNFWVLNSSEDRSFQIEAELLAIGKHIYIWVDTRANVSRTAAQNLAYAFDNNVYQQVRELWGSEATPGIDSDPRVYALFSYDLGYSLAAYFSSENIYPSEVVSTSNEHEMFIYNLDTIGTNIDNLDIESTTAHEFQHMIRANIYPNADTWLNEGLSMFTELYLGYGGSAWAAQTFIDTPGTQLNSWAEDGTTAPNYGASMLFITYFYERHGLDALQTVSLDKSNALLAFDNALRTLGERGVNEFFADWVLANYLQDKNIEDGRYGYEMVSLTRPYLTDTVRSYPYNIDARAAQYSTDYFRLRSLPDSGTLEIKLDAPESVSLLPFDDADGQFWYSNRADDSSLTLTRHFDLTGVTSATLNYRIWYHLENLWDYAYVMVSEDNGDTWTALGTSRMTTQDPYHNAYGIGYTGRSNGWRNEAIDLDAYAGKTILVRFWVINDDAVNQHGVAIDDVRVDAVGYRSDFNLNNGGWSARGWIWTDNRLPQQVWVQAAQIADNGEVSITRWLHPSDEPMMLRLSVDTEEIVLTVSPFAPLTTVPMRYRLDVSVSD